MRYTLAIQKILFQLEDDQSLKPKDKVRLLKQAIRIADENEDIEWGYDTRMELIRETYYVACADELIQHYSWILNAHATHPDLFDENDFLWQYKWILGEMYSNSKVSMEQINAVMDDFKMRLERNGYGLRSYYDRLYDEMVIIRNFDKAKQYLDLRNACPDDAMGNCAACTLDYELDYYLEKGDFEEAYNRAQPLLSRQLSCTHVPARTFCALGYYAEKAGKPELTAELFEKAEQDIPVLLDEGHECLTTPASLIIYYLLDKKPDTAWEYVEKTFPSFLESSDHCRFQYALNLLEGLRKESVKAPESLHLPIEFPMYNSNNKYSIQQLADYFHETARELALAFDKRNGCDAYQQRLKEVII